MQLEELIIPIKASDGVSSVIGGIVGKVGALIAVGGAAAIAFGTKAFLEAARVDELAIVNQVLAKNAGLAGATVKREAAEVKAMGIEAAVSEKVVARFIQAHLDLNSASELARVAQDAAVIAGENSTETTERLIHGITTLQPEVLRMAGITFTAVEAYANYAEETGKVASQLTQAEKQQAFLNMTLKKGVDIAGSYEAAMKEPGKVLRSMPRYINDIFVSVGKKLKPAFGEAIFAVADFTKGLGKAVAEGGALEPLMTAMGNSITPITKKFREFVSEIDWDKVGQSLEGLTAGFERAEKVIAGFMEHGFKSADVQKLFSDIGEGIGNIDWKGIGTSIDTWWTEFDKDMGIKIDAFDWEGLGTKIGKQITEKVKIGKELINAFITGSDETKLAIPAILTETFKGLGEMVAAAIKESGGWELAGDNFAEKMNGIQAAGQTAFHNSIETWKEKNAESGLGVIIADWFTNEVKPKLEEAAGNVGKGIPITLSNGFGLGLPTFWATLLILNTDIDNKLRDIAKTFFNRALSWAGQMLKGFEDGNTSGMLDKIREMVGAINSILNGILTRINVNVNVNVSTSGNHVPGRPDSRSGTGGATVTAGLIGGRASGGPTIAGQSYLAGEYGPEMFTAANSGRFDKLNNGGPAVVKLIEDDIRHLAQLISTETVKAYNNV